MKVNKEKVENEKRKWQLTAADERLRGRGTWKGRAIGASLSAALSSLVSIVGNGGGGLLGGGGGADLFP